MADGTRLRTMEESLRKTETQLLEIQQFVATSKQFMEETRSRQDEHQKLIEEQGRKSDQQFSQMTEMLRMLLQKDQSPTASNLRNNSVQEPLDRGILGASSHLPEQRTVGTPPRSSSIASSHDLGDSSSLAASYEKQDRDVLEIFPSRCNRGVHGFQEDVGAQKLVSFDSRMRENINAHKVFVEKSRPSVHQFLVKSNSEFLEGNHEIPSPEFPETDVNLNVKLVCDIVLVDSMDDSRTNSVDSLSAQQVFVIMSRRRKFTLVLGDKILALFARGLTLISSAVDATMKAEIVDHSLPWDPGGNCCYWFIILKETVHAGYLGTWVPCAEFFFLWAWNLLASVEVVAAGFGNVLKLCSKLTCPKFASAETIPLLVCVDISI